MAENTAHPPFPLIRTIICMIGATAVLAGIASFLIPQVFPDAEQVNKTVIVAAILIGSLSVVSMVVIAIAAPFGVKMLVTAFFASMGIRMIGVLGGAKLMTNSEFIPTGKPLALTLGAIYLPLLMIEVAAIMVYINRNTLLATQNSAGTNVSTEAGA